MHDNLYAAAKIPVTQGSDLSVIPGVKTVIKSLISYWPLVQFVDFDERKEALGCDSTSGQRSWQKL